MPREYDIQVLNTIRDGASTQYQERVPQATQDNITAVANAITNYTVTFNEFTQVLIGKIGKTIIESKMADNELKRFKKGMLPFGKDIEEIWVEMAQAEGAFDPTGANPLGRRRPEILAMYHRQNRQDKYVVSTSEEQVKTAFMSGGGVTDLLGKVVNSIYSGAEYDEFEIMKKLLADYEDKYFNYEVSAVTDQASASAFVRTVRKAVTDLKFVSTEYNNAEVKTFTKPQDQALLINKDVIAHVDVDVLAHAFNLGKTDFEPTIIVVDNFADMEDTYGLLIDKNFFMVYDTLNRNAEQFNADGLFTNHFLHIHQILSLSEFKNAVRFTTSLPEEESE